MEIVNNIGKRIVQIRKKQNISKVALSEKSGFGVSRLGNWEAGIRTPKLEDAKLLARVLGVSSAYLLCLVDSEHDEGYVGVDNRFNSIPLYAVSELTSITECSLTRINSVEKLPLPKFCDKLVDQQAFAIRLFDNSMSPQFNKNQVLVFLPEKEPKHNDIVLVSLSGLAEPLVRKFYLDTSDTDKIVIKLMPINADWITNTVKDPSALTIHGVLSGFETVVF